MGVYFFVVVVVVAVVRLRLRYSPPPGDHHSRPRAAAVIALEMVDVFKMNLLTFYTARYDDKLILP